MNNEKIFNAALIVFLFLVPIVSLINNFKYFDYFTEMLTLVVAGLSVGAILMFAKDKTTTVAKVDGDDDDKA